MKAASDKVGQALNEVKDDAEVASTLTTAKGDATTLEGNIDSELGAYVAALPNKVIAEKKKQEFEAVLTKAAEDVKSKLTGVHIFADIA